MANTVSGVDANNAPILQKNRGTVRAFFTLDSVGDSPPIDLSGFRNLTFLFRAASGTPVFSADLYDYDGTQKQGKHTASSVTSLGPQSFLSPLDQVVVTVNSLTGGTLTVEVRAT